MKYAIRIAILIVCSLVLSCTSNTGFKSPIIDEDTANAVEQTEHKSVELSSCVSCTDLQWYSGGHINASHNHNTVSTGNCFGYASVMAVLGYNSTCPPENTCMTALKLPTNWEEKSITFEEAFNDNGNYVLRWDCHAAFLSGQGYGRNIKHNAGSWNEIKVDYSLAAAESRSAVGGPGERYAVYGKKDPPPPPPPPPPPDPPDAPTIYASTQNGHPKVYWNSVSGADGYKIYRKCCSSSGTYYQIASTTSSQYVDTSADIYTGNPYSKVYYYYKVKAYNSGGSSSYSNWKQFTCNDEELIP